jgi:hypothetical protein
VVTITSEDGRNEQRLDINATDDAERIVLVDADGWEYHFGARSWPDRFAHVATYTPESGRERYVWWRHVQEGLTKGSQLRDEPELGPKLEPLVERALRSLLESCNLSNGFAGQTEKRWATEHLRAIWHESEAGFDPDEVAVWAATHGWTLDAAKDLRDIAAGVREGKQFRSAGRVIRRDPAREREMVARWREELAT